MGPGMMGWGSTGEFTGTLPYSPGMMRGWRGMGPGMMGGCPGMGGWGYATPGTGERLTLEQAVGTVEDYLAAYNRSSGIRTSSASSP